MAWEWGNIVRRRGVDDLVLIHAGTMILAVVLAMAEQWIAAIAVLVPATAVILWVGQRRQALLSALGVPYIGIASVGLIWLHSGGDSGLLAILLVFACVWSNDTFAMLVGRSIGGPLLWPRVSPNKTWAGLLGGLVASCVAGMLMHEMVPGTSLIWLAGVGLILGIAALAGDLVESALKRLHNVRHASTLIPGHGGFLDRLDGAIAAIVVAATISCLTLPEVPGQGLLNGHLVFGAAI